MTQAPRKKARSSGILLHPTSLPGPYGIGDLGPAAFAWIDALAHCRQKWWQILPLGPTGFGDSPYQCFSAIAGNPYLVSPQFLREDGLLDEKDLPPADFPPDHVDWGRVIPYKLQLLQRAWQNFKLGKGVPLRPAFDKFVHDEAIWLADYALFRALKDAHKGASWLEWPEAARQHQPAYLERARRDLADAIGLHQFQQFLFFRQWQRVRAHAHERGVKIIGDLPIFVSIDSSDVWANPQMFLLDAKHHPKVVAGVPPDYFSSTGQLWGNPLYDWAALERSGFAWWLDRFRATLRLFDVIRLDHFRGFEAYWEVPAGQPTAVKGRWVKAPGAALFTKLRQALGGLPLLAEDLGLITPEVEKLRCDFHLPGMIILQFAFGDTPENRYLPHNFTDANMVVYTGTHDNDTTHGWYETAPDRERDLVRRYLARDGGDISWDMIRLAWSSICDYALAPLQDVLCLGSEARMNSPGKPQGNWGWRYQAAQLTQGYLDRLAEMTQLYGRG
jgi:4-alpha-glucanotransferase